jgi:diguanylate cyclase (GGDEF)-like protein
MVAVSVRADCSGFANSCEANITYGVCPGTWCLVDDALLRLTQMLAKIDRFMSGRSDSQNVVLVLLLVTLFASIDLLTGKELSFSVFYTIPIAIASWYGGRRVGLVFCVICAVTWCAIDYVSGSKYSHPSIHFWNAGVRFTFFYIISILLCRLRTALNAESCLARCDSLTGILNLRGFTEESDLLLKLAGRHGHSMTLGYLDLDGFKAINDSLGHNTGDEVIRSVARALQEKMRSSDRCARIGGDEFVILLPETGMEGAQVFFASLKGCLFEMASQRNWPLGFSFGVVVLDSPMVSVEETIHLADELMYKVKKSGKNSILYKSSAELLAET